MKTEGQIRHQLAQIRFRYLKAEIRSQLSRRPCNCLHNGLAKGPRTKIHLCLLPPDTTGGHIVCDEAHGGIEVAHKCPFFQPRLTKEEIRSEFTGFLATSTRGEIAARYPDLTALLWVLDQEGLPDDGATATGATDGDFWCLYRTVQFTPGCPPTVSTTLHVDHPIASNNPQSGLPLGFVLSLPDPTLGGEIVPWKV